MQQIKNIIFDLGGVLLDIDYHKTADAFKKLGFADFDEMYGQFKANEVFESLETGTISNEAFLNHIISLAPRPVTSTEVTTAWNAMLLDFRTESLVFLEAISTKYNLFLLSNTNAIHLEKFRQIFTEQTGKATLDSYFSTAWYSHLIGKRKPYPGTYQYVMDLAGLEPSATLFIDDSSNNITGAARTGLATYLLKPGEKIEDLGL